LIDYKKWDGSKWLELMAALPSGFGSYYQSGMLNVTYYSKPSQSSGHQEPCAYFGVLIALLWG
jgi:hypothetical protein